MANERNNNEEVIAPHEIWPPFELGWMAGLDSLDPRECPFEKMTSEWHEWQSAHGKAVEYKREREKELAGK